MRNKSDRFYTHPRSPTHSGKSYLTQSHKMCGSGGGAFFVFGRRKNQKIILNGQKSCMYCVICICENGVCGGGALGLKSEGLSIGPR